jgi:creatinine amidohydrolase
VDVLRAEGRVALWTMCSVHGGDAHAGQTETSMMLALDPRGVRGDRLVAGNTEPLSTLMPLLRKEGVRAASPNGVLGDARDADEQHGRRLLDAMAARACDDVMASLHSKMGLAAKGGRT